MLLGAPYRAENTVSIHFHVHSRSGFHQCIQIGSNPDWDFPWPLAHPVTTAEHESAKVAGHLQLPDSTHQKNVDRWPMCIAKTH